MLKMYAATWCPHCTKTGEYLKNKGISFEYIDIEKEQEPVVQKIVEVNGGDDWVVPTLELDGKWRPGKVFNADELDRDLKNWGVI